MRVVIISGVAAVMVLAGCASGVNQAAACAAAIGSQLRSAPSAGAPAPTPTPTPPKPKECEGISDSDLRAIATKALAGYMSSALGSASASISALVPSQPSEPTSPQGSPGVSQANIGQGIGYRDGLKVYVEDARRTTGPNATSAAVTFMVAIKNDTTAQIDVSRVQVSLSYGDGATPAEQFPTSETSPLAGMVSPGQRATGRYGFAVPPDGLKDLQIRVQLGAYGHGSALFTGSADTAPSGPTSPPAQPSALPSAPVATPASEPAATAAPVGMQGSDTDNGWVLVGSPSLALQVTTLVATVQVRNDSNAKSASLQLTYGAGGPSPVVLIGFANEVAKGKTVTVQLLAGTKVDKVPAGKPDFRVTASF